MSRFTIYKDGARVGPLQNCSSVQWLEHYQAPGEVKIVALPTDENKALLTPGTRIYNPDSDTIAIVAETEIATDNAGEKTMVVRADISMAQLEDRVVTALRRITNIEQGMYDLVRDNLRGLPIALAVPAGFPETTAGDVRWNSVLNALRSLATESGLGFKMRFNPATAADTFQVYKGTDRTQRNADYVGFFSDALGNVETYSLTNGTIGYKNVAIVVSEGTVVTVSLGAFTGADRRELDVNAHDIRPDFTRRDATKRILDRFAPLATLVAETRFSGRASDRISADETQRLNSALATIQEGLVAINADMAALGIGLGITARVQSWADEFRWSRWIELTPATWSVQRHLNWWIDEFHRLAIEEYMRRLNARGMEVLAEHLRTFDVECEINQNNMRFGTDYSLGDRLPIVLDEHGISMTARVASVLRVYETEGMRTVATLDEFRMEE